MQIGTTSYIYPDDIIPNVRKLVNLVDDIELVLFEGKDYSNLPSADEVKTLREKSRRKRESPMPSSFPRLPFGLVRLSSRAGAKAIYFKSKGTVERIASLRSFMLPSFLPRRSCEAGAEP